MKRPKILVTNDDGIVAPGIKVLVEIVKKIGDVVVVAPDKPQSGQGHAITLESPLRLKKVELFEGVESYECSGTPVDCVKLAKSVILKEDNIDLCVSGINHGSNASINIIYSGTMSAAMEASLEGINSIGFSFLDFSFKADFTNATPYIESIIRSVLDKKTLPSRLINVNIPKGDIAGIKVCRQAKGVWVEEFKESIDPRGEPYYWMTGKFDYQDSKNDNDLKALEAGYISVVPSHHDLTHYSSIDALKYLETSEHE
ncbi:MAG: 5'/3'-nucleotidase SurE [Saprospiraceae bacterium]|nr:5'/3'-nucleotidase SurE [Saprospiraceae bacterium]